DDQLAAAVEEIEQARRAVRAFKAVRLLHSQPRHAAPLCGERVTGSCQFLLLDQQLLAGCLPLLRRHARGLVHDGITSLVVWWAWSYARGSDEKQRRDRSELGKAEARRSTRLPGGPPATAVRRVCSPVILHRCGQPAGGVPCEGPWSKLWLGGARRCRQAAIISDLRVFAAERAGRDAFKRCRRLSGGAGMRRRCV